MDQCSRIRKGRDEIPRSSPSSVRISDGGRGVRARVTDGRVLGILLTVLCVGGEQDGGSRGKPAGAFETTAERADRRGVGRLSESAACPRSGFLHAVPAGEIGLVSAQSFGGH